MSRVRFETPTCPASVTQEQFWLLNQMHPESPAYNIPFMYRINGPLSCEALEKSINEMIRRHGVLRSCFVVDKGTLVQKTAADMPVQIGVESVEGLTGDEVNRMVAEEVRRPFVLSELPLIRIKLLRLEEEKFLFLVVMHHIITDLRTKALFTEELSTLYGALLSGKPLTVSPAPQYTEFARWQKAWVASDECASMISFWRDEVAVQSGRLGLPMDQERPREISYRGEALPFHLDASFMEVLQEYSRQNRVSLFLILLAAYAVFLFKSSGQSRLVIGVPLTNRRQDRFKNTLGCFVNILPLSLAFTEDTTFSELLRHVRLAMLKAHRNQELPYYLVVKALGIKREPNHNPLFQVGFTCEPPYPLGLAGLDVLPVPLDRGGSQLDLFFRWWEEEEGKGLRGFFEYHPELFDLSSVRCFASQYKALLRELVCDSGCAVSSLSFVPDREKGGRGRQGQMAEGLPPQGLGASPSISSQGGKPGHAPAGKCEERVSEVKMKEKRSCHGEHGFGCFIVGEGALLIRCAKRLLERGCPVHGIISTNRDTLKRADEIGLPSLDQGEDFLSVMRGRPFDYLFSIVNNSVLPGEVLALPGKYAINYHDAPLPHYAGVNATAWAILNQEKAYGISWHVMTDLIDAGDLLSTQAVDITPDDTSLSLNAKCFEAAYIAFDSLVDQLLADGPLPVKQDLTQRTYHGVSKRPQGGAHLSFRQAADEIDALVRALDFGRNHPNTLFLPKICLSGEFVIVSGLSVLPATSKAPAGTIVAADEGALTVATESSDVSVTQLLTQDGGPFPIPEFMAYFDLCVGDRIQDLSPRALERITELSRKLCRHEPYWQDALASFEPLSLTYAKQAPPSSEEAERYTEEIPVSERVARFIDEAVPGQADCFLSAAFAAYLARVNDSGSFDIGVHVRSQNQDVADAMGLFSLFVPLKVTVDVEGSFAQFYKGFCRDMEARAAHKTYARDLIARVPAFSHDPDGYLLSKSDVSICWTRDLDMYEELSLKHAKQSPMALVVPEGARTLFLRYRPDCLSPYYAQSIKKQFGVFLEGLVGELETPLCALPLLTEDERHRLVRQWNSTSRVYPDGMCLHHVFEAQVNRTPDITAVTFGETALSYRELDERANQLAHHLRRFGVGPEVLVGIVMERSLEMIVGIYGILKAGGAYVPLDPDYPPDRLAYMLGDTDVPVILTQHHLLTKIPENKAHTLCLDTQWGEVAREGRAKPEDGSSPDDLAYVIYTSGSTGKPKGVMNCHNGICNRLWWMQEAYSLTRDDHVLQKTPYSFDVSVWEFFWPLQVGARLVVAPPGIHKEPGPLIDTINKERITTLHFVPSMLQAFLKDREATTCSSITRVICSGEALPFDLQQRFFNTLDAELHNLYGPTEAAVDVSYYECRRDTAIRVVPIGKPVSNTQLYILDRNLNPVPVGAAGELHIGGVQVARGYLNRPELTEEKFIPDRFDGDGGRLYKTGDLARYLPDGNIEYLGRNDFQIKIRGMRIELGEIEAVLCEHPEVYEAVVAAGNGASGHGRVVAYYVTGAGGALSAVTLRNHLKEKLPDHMVPALFVQMEALPLLGNGKVNRKALPAPTTERPEVATQYAVPRTGVEKAIAGVWKSQLGIDAVGIDDNFFEVGGDSLLLVQIAGELSRTLSPDLKVHHLFEFPTIRSVAGFLDSKPDRGPEQDGMHIEARQQKRKATLAKRNKNRRGAFK